MQAYELTIAAKVKPNPFALVAATDFQVQRGRAIDPRVVLEQPNLSLYCLDHANQHGTTLVKRAKNLISFRF